jgi:hypothetical protein
MDLKRFRELTPVYTERECRHSVKVIVNRIRAGIRIEARDLLCSETSKPVPKPTQSPVQWVAGAPSPEGKVLRA